MVKYTLKGLVLFEVLVQIFILLGLGFRLLGCLGKTIGIFCLFLRWIVRKCQLDLTRCILALFMCLLGQQLSIGGTQRLFCIEVRSCHAALMICTVEFVANVDNSRPGLFWSLLFFQGRKSCIYALKLLHLIEFLVVFRQFLAFW